MIVTSARCLTPLSLVFSIAIVTSAVHLDVFSIPITSASSTIITQMLYQYYCYFFLYISILLPQVCSQSLLSLLLVPTTFSHNHSGPRCFSLSLFYQTNGIIYYSCTHPLLPIPPPMAIRIMPNIQNIKDTPKITIRIRRGISHVWYCRSWSLAAPEFLPAQSPLPSSSTRKHILAAGLKPDFDGRQLWPHPGNRCWIRVSCHF